MWPDYYFPVNLDTNECDQTDHNGGKDREYGDDFVCKVGLHHATGLIAPVRMRASS